MSLMKQIVKDQIEARKSKDTVKASILTTLIGEASMVGKNDGNRETTDVEVQNVIKKFVKNIDETLKVKMSESLTYEKNILQKYLPKQMSSDELTSTIMDIIKTIDNPSMSSMGTVMKELKAGYDGLYNGKEASDIVKDMLK